VGVHASFPWYDTITPAEHADAARSSLFPTASTRARAAGARIKSRRLGVANGGWPAVTRGPDELFLLHGSLAFRGFRGATVTRVDTAEWTPVWSTPLIDAVAAGEWNYPGSIVAHANGALYVVYGYRLARIDAGDGRVLGTAVLPTSQAPKDVTYNGLIVLPDGKLLCKSLYRMPGCTENGFRALARGGVVELPSDVVVIDPDTLAVTSVARAPEHVLGRISAGVHDGATRVYAAGQDAVHRFAYADDDLRLDDWGPVAYRTPGESPGSAIAVVDGWIFIQGNAGPGRAPLHVTAISQADPRRVHSVCPFPDNRWMSFNAAKLSVDPATLRVYTSDGIAGALACYDFDPREGFRERWRQAGGTYTFMLLLGPSDERVLVTTHLRDNPLTWLVRTRLSWWLPWLAYVSAGEEVVWRDAATGRELVRSGRLPMGLAVVPGFDGRIYYPTVFKGLVELTVEA
jgi:hypothetical protein